MSKYIRTENEILDTKNTNECIYVISDHSIEEGDCYVSYIDDWRKYFLIDYQNCIHFSYNSAQSFIENLVKENLKYQNLIIELSPYYKDCKQANTIEKLCDYFVYKQNYKITIFEKMRKPKREDEIALLVNPLTRNNGFVAQGISKTMLQLGNEVYGAIWTPKGLIYVAKMNSNGEFELL